MEFGDALAVVKFLVLLVKQIKKAIENCETNVSSADQIIKSLKTEDGELNIETISHLLDIVAILTAQAFKHGKRTSKAQYQTHEKSTSVRGIVMESLDECPPYLQDFSSI